MASIASATSSGASQHDHGVRLPSDEIVGGRRASLPAMSGSIEWSELSGDLRGIASLATVTPDGQAHVSIVSTTLVDDIIWIGTSRSARKAINVAANPSLALVWSGDAEIYLWGHGRLVDDVGTKRSLWASAWAYDPAMFFENPESDDYVLISVRPERAMSMDFGEAGPEQRRWTADRSA